MNIEKKRLTDIIEEEIQKLLKEENTRGPTIMKASGEGYYIGYEIWDEESQRWLPYDRMSQYYPTLEEAEEDLVRMKKKGV